LVKKAASRLPMNPGTPITYKRAHTPTAIRLLNAVARPIGRFSSQILALESSNLLARACAKTRLADWGHPSALQALEVLLASVRREGRLTVFGRFAFRQYLIGKLCSRLRIIEALKCYPAIARQDIRRPVFITGWYRTGTTYLHNLLAGHPQSRAPLYWELMHPCPAADPDSVNSRKLIRQTVLASRIHRYLAPQFNRVHPMAAEKPEECLHLFENAAMGTMAFFITEAKSIAWWLLENDLGQGYRFYKKQIQLLNWLRPGRRWVLKWPYHVWHLDALLAAFPDATVVWLHRNPQAALASVCSLSVLARAPFCEDIDSTALGRFWTDYNEAGLRRAMAARAKAGPNQIVDVAYADLVANPTAVIRRIIAAAGLEPDGDWLKTLPHEAGKQPQNKRGRHRYNLEQFGLRPEDVRRRFGDYIKTYDIGP